MANIGGAGGSKFKVNLNNCSGSVVIGNNSNMTITNRRATRGTGEQTVHTTTTVQPGNHGTKNNGGSTFAINMEGGNQGQIFFGDNFIIEQATTSNQTQRPASPPPPYSTGSPPSYGDATRRGRDQSSSASAGSQFPGSSQTAPPVTVTASGVRVNGQPLQPSPGGITPFPGGVAYTPEAQNMKRQ